MNKFMVRFIGLFSLFIASPAWAWTIEEFTITADIQPDGSVMIEETINADFTGETYKHGIFRTIPYAYKDARDKTFQTPIENLRVTNANGQAHNFTQTKNGADISIKIGDADKTVNVTETYVINYTVTGVLNAFETHDEFYWNVTGNEWDAPINKVKAVVKLPTSFKTPQLKCFTGFEDSKAENCTHQVAESMDTAFFKTYEPLNTGEGFTIVLGWDKNLVSIPERQYTFDLTYWAKRLQYLFLLFPAWAAFKNLKIRKELKPQKALIPLYHPPEKLGVGLIGFFDRGKANTRDLTALLTQLGVKGFLKIKETPASGAFDKEGYEFTRLESSDVKLDKEAQFVLEHLPIETGKTMRLKDLVKLQNSIFKHSHYQTLVNQIRLAVSPYFRKSDGSDALKFLGFAFLFFWLFFFGLVASALASSLLPSLALMAGMVALVALPQFGRKGQAIKHDIKGYKLFLSTADKDRINWSEAQNIFETNLPYAIALNLTDKWAEIFADKIEIPQWYEGKTLPNFKSFEKNITASAATSIRRSTPRTTSSSQSSSGFSRGGGRSGGGFGGGGGGSW